MIDVIWDYPSDGRVDGIIDATYKALQETTCRWFLKDTGRGKSATGSCFFEVPYRKRDTDSALGALEV